METFSDRFAGLPPGQVDPSVFAQLGRDPGVTVLEPPLAISHPLQPAVADDACTDTTTVVSAAARTRFYTAL